MTAALRYSLLLAAALFTAHLAAGPSRAQNLLGLQSDGEPLEINAEYGIEWRRDSQVYIASGNARAAQGELEVFADTLTAHYREAVTGGTEIYRLDAEGNVRIVTPSETLYGDEGFYDTDKGLLHLTGDNLRLESDEDLITARDSLEYWEAEQVAVARGDAVAIREDTRVQADVLIARFQPDQSGKLALATVDAKGNVRISTPTEFGRGDSGVYYVEQQLATLTGSVKLTRGQNQMNGQYAEFNLETGISRLLAAPPGQSGGAPVRGLLVPEEKSKPDSGS